MQFPRRLLFLTEPLALTSSISLGKEIGKRQRSEFRGGEDKKLRNEEDQRF